MSLYVKLNYTQNNKNKKIMKGYLNINTVIFKSEKNDYSFNLKNVERYSYSNRIIFVNNDKKRPQEWIFQIIPTKKILTTLGIKETEESESEVEIEENESKVKNKQHESDPDYDPDEEYDDFEDEDDFDEY